MASLTFFKKTENGNYLPKSFRGANLKASLFDERAKGADIVRIYKDNSDVFFTMANGVWSSALWFTGKSYARYILKKNRVNYAMEIESLSDEEGRAVLDAQVKQIKCEAAEAISWCDPKDEKDAAGRYWLSVYQGAGTYRLVVADGKIKGAICGGFHGCSRSVRAAAAGELAFIEAAKEAIKERLGTDDFRTIKATGSGTHFYLCNADDAAVIQVKKEEVASDGGRHINLEIV